MSVCMTRQPHASFRLKSGNGSANLRSVRGSRLHKRQSKLQSPPSWSDLCSRINAPSYLQKKLLLMCSVSSGGSVDGFLSARP